MLVCFADDAQQRRPSRERMGPLVAAGGLIVPGDAVGPLERDIEAVCRKYGFPAGEEFKWSPRRDQWMYASLVEDNRAQFFTDVLRVSSGHGAAAVVVIEDASQTRAIADSPNAEADVTRLLLERVENRFSAARSDGIVVVDRPAGDRAAEDRFLTTCLETLQSGTRYVKPEHVAVNVLSTPSHLVRLVQAADLVTSCTVAAVAGEARYAPPIFEAIRPMFPSELGRIGGVGLKIHPDYVYANLYHWLGRDRDLVRGNSGIPLPTKGRPYADDPNRW
jgi:uncharacterized protein DUF3800